MRRRKGPSPGRNQRPAQALPTRATPSPKTPFDREQTTKRRGEISELAFALAAARQGFGISRPYGDSERYDLILDPSHIDPHSRPRLVRVQVKATTQVVEGLYRVNAHRRINGHAVPYTLSEIDFIAAHIIPEDSWFILPLAHILGQTSLLFRPKKSRRPCPYAHYREAWPLLRQPDGLEFA
ncbi:MAG: group I intron-associated PD-(D/E)XK endonuclease [Candidatus Sulfotelmatobacter sp.]